MILGKPETVQITVRDTKDCFYLYEVPPSRVAKQVIGPRIPRSGLEHLGDKNWDVVDADEIDSEASQDLLKRVLRLNPSLNSSTARLG